MEYIAEPRADARRRKSTPETDICSRPVEAKEGKSQIQAQDPGDRNETRLVHVVAKLRAELLEEKGNVRGERRVLQISVA